MRTAKIASENAVSRSGVALSLNTIVFLDGSTVAAANLELGHVILHGGPAPSLASHSRPVHAGNRNFSSFAF
jgi:hypothetical protein